MFRNRHPHRDAEAAASSHSHNVAARMGRWSAAHWKTATFGWLALVVLAFGIGNALSTNTIDTNTAGPGESGRMDRILDAGFKQPAHEAVLIQSNTLRVGDPAFRGAIEDLVAGVSALGVVQHVRSPLDPPNAGQIAKDRRSALVEFDIRATRISQPTRSARSSTVSTRPRVNPELFIGTFGDASAQDGVDTAFAKDLEKAGLFSLPITLAILVVAFGALVAAGIPLLLGLTAVFTTFGLIAIPSQLLPIAEESYAMVLLSSGSQSVSTTRCSTCGAPARSVPPGGLNGLRSRLQQQRRVARCSLPASPSWRWPACS